VSVAVWISHPWLVLATQSDAVGVELEVLVTELEASVIELEVLAAEFRAVAAVVTSAAPLIATRPTPFSLRRLRHALPAPSALS
jgi:hypothetical protein